MNAHYCFDTSGIVKRYVFETGSAWVATLTDPAAGHRIHLASVTAVEVVSAITRRRLAGSLTAAIAAAVVASFRQDLAREYRTVDLSPALIDRAMDLAAVHGLRGYDAVQLAVALDVYSDAVALGRPFALVSADLDLNAAAVAEGLTVEDPNLHP